MRIILALTISNFFGVNSVARHREDVFILFAVNAPTDVHVGGVTVTLHVCVKKQRK